MTYTDEMPVWAVAMMGDMGSRPRYQENDAGLVAWVTSTRFHLPLCQMRAVYPDRVLTQGEAYDAGIGITHYFPNPYVNLNGFPWQLPPFEFTPDNTLGVERIEDS